MNSFTYIIRSDNITSGTVTDCQIQLKGLKSQYKSYDVEVMGLNVNFADLTIPLLPVLAFTNAYMELQSDNLPFINGFDTKNNKYKTVGSTLCNNGNSIVYKVSNFFGQYINLKIVGTLPTNFGVYSWIIILKMTGIEE
jgi:hypothetical protein